MPKKTLRLLTDVSHKTKRCKHSCKNIELRISLRNLFNKRTSHTNDTKQTLNIADPILIRNTDLQQSQLEQLIMLRRKKTLSLFKDLPGKGDIKDKQNLLDLFEFSAQPVNACRLKNGSLPSIELEDFNPFSSLNLTHKNIKEKFAKALCKSLKELISKKGGAI